MPQMKFILLYLLIFFFLGKTKMIQAQSYKSQAKQISKYYGIAVGSNNSKFRDFATSPLFYNGTVLQVGLSRLKINNRKEMELGFSFDTGTYLTDFNDNTTTSQVKRIELNYAQLYRLGFLSSETFNTKIGFILSGNGNLRVNTALQNNAAGIDIFGNLLGSIKITKDISREVSREKKFLFWRYTKGAKKRNLAFRLNAGLVNSSYRNGYAYSNHSSVLNNAKVLDDYEFNLFSGFRASSSLDYTRFLDNKNAVRFSYVWDAYSTGGDSNKFEMVHHTLKLILLFNTNNQ